MKRTRLTPSIATLAAAAIALTSMSCQSGEVGAVGCAVETNDDGSDDRLVIMKDGTTSDDAADDFTSDLAERILTGISLEGPIVSIGTYGGSDAEVTFSACFDGTHFRPNFNQPRRREEAAPELVAAAMADISQLPSDWPTTDSTSALRAGAEKLGTSSESARTLVVLTDGIPTAGCARLPENTDPTDGHLIAEIVQRCKDTGALPNLSGVDVWMIGIGRTGTGLSSEAVAFLSELNKALCEASDATCQVSIDVPSDL